MSPSERLTPIGHMLAQLPVDIIIGKMLIMATVFHVSQAPPFAPPPSFMLCLLLGDRACADHGSCPQCPVSLQQSEYGTEQH